jgi:hypothetical protein
MNNNLNMEEYENEELTTEYIFNEFNNKLLTNSISKKDIEKILLAIHNSNDYDMKMNEGIINDFY